MKNGAAAWTLFVYAFIWIQTHSEGCRNKEKDKGHSMQGNSIAPRS